MTLLIIPSLLVGALLAQRFRIMFVIPATTVALAATVGIAVAQAQTVWWTILTAVAASTSVQIGYLIGLGIRHVLEAAPEAGSLTAREEKSSFKVERVDGWRPSQYRQGRLPS